MREPPIPVALSSSMELVRGIRITDYCDQANLHDQGAPRSVHQGLPGHPARAPEGIIHRGHSSRRTSSSRSTTGVPVPKVIDFGIGKATEGRLTDRNGLYAVASIYRHAGLYEPRASGDEAGLDIDTRSDIYSLGVLLYELLVGSNAGSMPKELVASGLDTMRKTIRRRSRSGRAHASRRSRGRN